MAGGLVTRLLTVLLALSACSDTNAPAAEEFDLGARVDADEQDLSFDATDELDAGPDASDARPLDADVPDASPPCTGAPYPVVLHHGFFGFERIGPVRYWFNVASDLRDAGEHVTETLVDPFNDSLTRAEDLREQIDGVLADTNACKVLIVAHSQGGVDARALVSRLGYADKVAAIATISTPHRGTRVADLARGLVPGWGESSVTFLAGLVSQVISPGASESDLLGAFDALSPAAMATFNAETVDDVRVPIYSVAGRSLRARGRAVCADSVWANSGARDYVDTLLFVSASYLNDDVWGEGNANDGMVTVESARWGTFLGCIPADHFDEIGQIADLAPSVVTGFDHKAFYRELVAYLRSEGY
jgi:triacylglycerol lipase